MSWTPSERSSNTIPLFGPSGSLSFRVGSGVFSGRLKSSLALTGSPSMRGMELPLSKVSWSIPSAPYAFRANSRLSMSSEAKPD